MSIKNKTVDILFATVLILGSKVMNWLEQPEVATAKDAAERKRKRKALFRAVQSEAYRSKHPDYRRRSTDIHVTETDTWCDDCRSYTHREGSPCYKRSSDTDHD